MKDEVVEMLIEACQQCPWGCALERLNSAKGFNCNDLFDTAKAVGITKPEAGGIMDGWDVAEGKRPLFEQTFDYNVDEYSAGRLVGGKCFAHRSH